MPFASKRQERFFRAMLKRGEISQATFDRWAAVSAPYSELPERANPELNRSRARKQFGDEEVSELERLYQEFHGGLNLAERYEEVEVPDIALGLVMLGPCVQINYVADKGDGLCEYYHRFSEPYPVLAQDAAANLHILGGNYTITPDGIED